MQAYYLNNAYPLSALLISLASSGFPNILFLPTMDNNKKTPSILCIDELSRLLLLDLSSCREINIATASTGAARVVQKNAGKKVRYESLTHTTS